MKSYGSQSFFLFLIRSLIGFRDRPELGEGSASPLPPGERLSVAQKRALEPCQKLPQREPVKELLQLPSAAGAPLQVRD